MLLTCNSALYYYLGLVQPFGATPFHIDNLSAHGIITPAQAYAIDTKVDDGVPGTGGVLAVTVPDGYGYSGVIDTYAGQCVVSAAATAYNLTSNLQWCRLFVKMQ